MESFVAFLEGASLTGPTVRRTNTALDLTIRSILRAAFREHKGQPGRARFYLLC